MLKTVRHRTQSRLLSRYRPLVEMLEDRVVLANDFYQVPGVLGESVRLQFKVDGKATGANNELALYLVDDVQGRVDGLFPSQTGYAAAAAARAQSIFSATATVGTPGELTVQGGQRFGFLLVKRGSLAQWSQSNPGNLPQQSPLLLFSVDAANPQSRDAVRTSMLPNDAVRVRWEDATTASASRLFNDNSFIIKPIRGSVLTIPGQAGQTVTTTFTLAARNATLRNELGFFVADDANGTVDGSRPGDADYALKAISSPTRQVLFSSKQPLGFINRVTLPSGSNVVFYLIQNNTTAEFLNRNPNNLKSQKPLAFFSIPTANVDRFGHQSWQGFNRFGFEDQYGGGDKDFDDLVVRFTMESPKGAQETNPPVITAALRLDTAPGGTTNSDTITSVPDVQGTVTDQSQITSFQATLDQSNVFTTITGRLNSNGTFLLDRPLLNQLAGGTLSDGSHTLHLKARDQYGNTSAIYHVPFVLKTQAQLSVKLAPGSDTSPVGDLKTSVSVITLEGIAEPNAVVQLVGTALSATANALGEYSISGINLVSGANPFTVKTTDVAGNERSVPITIVYESPNDVWTFDDQLTGWIVEEFGGSPTGKGRVTASNGSATIREGDSFLISIARDFVVPGPDTTTLSVRYSLPVFDLSALGKVRDAFEISFVDSTGRTMVLPASQQRDVYFNITEGLGASAAPGVTEATGEVTVSLAGLTPGTTGRLALRLVNNDGDTQSQVTIHSVAINRIPGLTPPTASPVVEQNGQTSPSAIDFTQLTNVSTHLTPVYGRTSFNRNATQLYSALALTNSGNTPLRGPLVVVLDRISDPSIIPQDADGFLPDGRAYFDFSDTLTNNRLDQGATTATRSIHFFNPAKKSFTYDVQVYSLENKAPAFITQPSTLVPPGRTWNYSAQANDPNGDSVSYQLLSGPQGMTIDPTSGQMLWTIPQSFTGNTAVLIQANDGWGASAEQSFTLTVANVPNRPPLITSTPGVDAFVGQAYRYDVEAFDADFDPITFSLTQGLPGLSIQPTTGLLSLTPSASDLGEHIIVVQADDGHGGQVQQRFTLSIRNNQTNHAPQFVTDASLRVLAGQPYRYEARAIDADDDTVSYELSTPINGMTIDTVTGVLQWNTVNVAAGTYTVAIEAADGRGGVTEQRFDLQVVAGPAAIIRGNVFNDLLGDGPNQGGATTQQLTVNSHDAIFLAGRTDVTIPAIGVNDPTFPLLRTGGTGTGYSVERFPQQVNVSGGQILTFNASGIVNGLENLNFNVPPDGDRGGFATTINNTTSAISGYRGPIGALVGVFLGNDNPAGGTAPGTMNFDDTTGGSSQFETLSPQLGQVFFIGDGLTSKLTFIGIPNNGIRQRFTVPSGATRLFIGLPDGGPAFAPNKTPGRYDDNTGSFDVSVNILPASTVFFTDTEFANNNWTSAITRFDDGNPGLDGGDAGFFQVAGNGNPGAYREGFHYLRVGDLIVTGNLNQNAVYNPSTQGAIQSLHFDVDFRQISVFFQGPDQTAAMLYLEQGGTRYYGIGHNLGFGANQGGVDVWLTKSGNYTTADFDTNPLALLDPATADGNRPDFSSTGGPITFGFSMFNNAVGNQGKAVRTRMAIDNWSLQINRSQSDAALPNFRVYLDENGNKRYDVNEQSRLSDVNGGYEFTNLPAGPYTVRVEEQSGWRQTYPSSPGQYALQLNPGQISTGNDFGLQIDPVVNNSPRITTTPVTSGVVGQVYRYDVAGVGEGALFFDLPQKPAGMTVDRNTGSIVWLPETEQLGPQQVVVRLRDGSGRLVLQSFTIDVASPNTPPVFLSEPPLLAALGRPYQYLVKAIDAEGDGLTFSLATAPTGMTINASTGVVSWTPSNAQLGSVPVQIRVRDSHGAETIQLFSITVSATLPNTNPVISSMPSSRVRVGNLYRYQVIAADGEADQLSFSLISAPAGMVIDPTTGLLTWSPTGNVIRDHDVNIRVSDGQGGQTTQHYTLSVIGMQDNTPPVFLSGNPGDASAGRLFRFSPLVNDADGDNLLWSLTDAPAGMSINPTTGTIRWVPRVDQVGTQTFTIEVRDTLLATAERTFTLNVRGANTPPLIVSSPVTQAIVGQGYHYPLLALDAEGNELTYVLLASPMGMTIDSATGVLTWTPTAAQAGNQTVSVQVTDGQGGDSRQDFIVAVSAVPISLPPVITSKPALRGSINALYQYQVVANDPQSQLLTYSLQSGPVGMTMDVNSGLLTWTPDNSAVGAHIIILDVQNASGLRSQQVYTLTVGVNQAPVITSQPVTQTSAGSLYRYDLLANDPNGDPLSYLLLEGPGGMIVDANGRITWDAPAVGSSPVKVRVSDGRGGVAEQNYSLSVTSDTTSPQITVTFSQNPVPRLSSVVIRVTATDNVGVTDLILSINGEIIPLEADGTALYTPVSIVPLPVHVTALDAAGNAANYSTTLNVVYEQDPSGNGPTVSIQSPADNATLTRKVNITGTVDTDNQGAWRVMFAPVGSNNFQTLNSGTGPVFNGTLASFDPTLLANDQYTIRVVGQRHTGETSFREITVNVQGELKLGRFALSFTDMAVPLAGIPIQVLRSYDTLDASRIGDFGYGWRLGFADARIRETVPSNIGQNFFGPIDAPFKVGTRVFLTTPSGQRVGFTFDPVPVVIPFFGTTYWKPRFVADPGVQEKLDVLTEPDNYYGDLYIKRADGTFSRLYDFLGGSFNPNDYNLTQPDGAIYRYNQTDGLRQVVDTSGNTINFQADGIFSSNGAAIHFERDAQGRITRIIDPTGKTVDYSYDAAGNLVSIDNPEDITTTFTYRTTPAHFLETVLDPRGNQAMRTEYDSQGRVTAYIDANGNRTVSSYDQNANSETITDPLGNPSTLTYDNEGRLLSVRDSLNNTYRYEYDDQGNLTRAITPTGSAVTRVFDSEHRITSMVDPLGRQFHVTYNTNGSIKTVSDDEGRISTLLYDDLGRMSGQVNALGEVSRMVRDSMGRVIRYTDAAGNVTTYEYQGASPRPSVTTYPDGAKRTYQYNAQGLIISAKDELGFVTTYEYDSIGRAIKVNFADGASIRYTYNLDQLESKIDQLGNVTRYELDSANKLRKVIDPLGNVTEVVYDANGQIIRQTDAENRSVAFTYRADGRLLSKTDPAGMVTSYEYDGAGNVTAQTEHGETTRYTYDAFGKLTSVTNALNQTSRYEYDSAGNMTKSIDPLNHELRFTYDALNRVTSKTNQLGETTTFSYDLSGNLSQVTDALGRVATNHFDSRNRIIQTDQPGGVNVRYAYDLAGNTTAVTDIQNRTTRYDYDSMGRLFRMTDPNGRTEVAEFDLTGNTTALIDPLGHRTTMEYNPLGLTTKVTDAAGLSTSFEYNKVGQRTAVIEPGNVRTSFSYDAAGRLIRRTDPAGHVDQYEYDLDGLLTRTIDSTNKEMTYEYNDLGYLTRQTAISNGSSDVRTYAYDAAGNMIQAGNSAGTYQFTYDAANRLASQQFVTSSQAPNSTQYFSYDAAGRLVQVRDNFNAQVNSTFDDRDRLITRTWQGNQLSSVRIDTTYNGDDQPDTVTRYADLTGTQKVGTSQYSYDTLGRVTGITHKDASNATLAQYGYQYDALDRVTQATENGNTINYAYDLTGQLLSAQRSAGPQEAFTYDAAGNRQGNSRVYDNLDRLLSDANFNYTYDADGRLTTKTNRSNGDVTQLSYNARNQIESISETDSFGNESHDSSFTYDVFGQKVATLDDSNLTSTSYVGGNPWADYGNSIPLTRYLFGGLDDLVARDSNQSETEWYLTDRLGSVRDLTNSSGQTIDHIEYDSFGKVLSESNPGAGDRFKFTGREYLADFDLYDFRARLYDPNAGRFLSEDPLGYSGGQSNFYSYVNNDPINHTDPLGLFSIGEYAGSLLSSNAIVNALFNHGGDGYFSLSVSVGSGGVRVGAGGDYSFSGSLGPQFKQFDTKLDWGIRNGSPFGSVSGGQHGLNLGGGFDGNGAGGNFSVDPQAMFKSFSDYHAFNATEKLRQNRNTYDMPLVDFMNSTSKTGLGPLMKDMLGKPTTMGFQPGGPQKPPPPDEADFTFQAVSTARAPNFLMRFNAAAFGLPAVELNLIAEYLTAPDSQTTVRVQQSLDLPDPIGPTDWEGRGFAVRKPNRPNTFTPNSPPWTPPPGTPTIPGNHHNPTGGGFGGPVGGGLGPPWQGGPPLDASGCAPDLISSLGSPLETINGRPALQVDCCSYFFAYYYAKTRKCYRFLDTAGML